MGKKITAIISMVILISGGIFLISFGGYRIAAKQVRSRNYAVTEGRISSIRTNVNHSNSSNGFSNTSYSPIYEFEVDGIAYHATLGYGIGKKPEIGKKGTIKYNPANPSEAYVKGAVNLNVLWIVGGIVCLGITGMIYLMTFQDESNPLREPFLNIATSFVLMGLGFGMFYGVMQYVNILISGILLAFGGVGVYLLVCGIRMLIVRAKE